MDQRPFIRRGAAHGFEIRHGLRENLPVEPENDASYGFGVGTGGEILPDKAVRAEVAGTDAEVHEDPIRHGNGIRRGRVGGARVGRNREEGGGGGDGGDE